MGYRVIGLDGGEQCGIGVVDAKGSRIHSMEIDLKRDTNLKHIPRAGDTKHAEHIYLFLERGGWRGPRNAFSVGKNTGALIERLGLYRKAINYVLPSEWKKVVLGTGSADKDAALQYCIRNGYTPKGHNEAEALCIARYGVMMLAEKPDKVRR